MSERKIAYAKASSELARLSDSDLIAQLEQATALGEGIGGPTYRLDVAGVPTFVKRIPLTELEQQNPMSTANIFDLPTHYQYGVGSAGFGAWRELRAHLMTTEWVLAGTSPSFPLLYHWRVLSREPQATDNAWWHERWEHNAQIDARHQAIDRATASIVVFLEFAPDHVHEWLHDHPDALERVETELLEAVDVMNRNGLLHFDAHFNNVMADDDRIYITDFGLATCTQFELSAAERTFVASHRAYDRAMSSLMLAMTSARLDGHAEPVDHVRRVADGGGPPRGRTRRGWRTRRWRSGPARGRGGRPARLLRGTAGVETICVPRRSHRSGVSRPVRPLESVPAPSPLPCCIHRPRPAVP